MKNEIDIFTAFLKGKGLRLTKQRQEILSVFLKSKKHLSVEDLYNIVKKKKSSIGQTTVFRTLKLLILAGIAKETDLGDKRIRYEHKYGSKHHDHLICISCGTFIEAVHPQIEKLQNSLCRKFDFLPKKHRLEIFGLCKKCRKK